MMHMPNIRELFIPDPGMEIAECDLEQADARVVAWDADDETLKAIFRDPTKDLHMENAKTIWGPTAGPIERQRAKQGVHATNYGVSAYKLSHTLNISQSQADHFQRIWFAKHPKIKAWQNRVQHDIMTKRKVTNKFGYHRIYFGRIEDLLKEALAWIPQSTVAIAVNHALLRIHKELPEVQLLLQVHDSVVFQYPAEMREALLPKLHEIMQVTIPYDDPLIIPSTIKVSTKSWGACEKVKWPGT